MNTILSMRLMDEWLGPSHKDMKEFRRVSKNIRSAVNHLFWKNIVLRLETGTVVGNWLLMDDQDAKHVQHLKIHFSSYIYKSKKTVGKKEVKSYEMRLVKFLQDATNLRTIVITTNHALPLVAEELTSKVRPLVERIGPAMFEKTDRLWAQIIKSLPKVGKGVTIGNQIKQLFPSLKSLTVSIDSPNIKINSIPHVDSLELRFGGSSVPVSVMHDILQANPTLKSVTLESWNFSAALDTTQSYPLPAHQSVTELKLTYCLPPESLFGEMLNSFPNLEKFEFFPPSDDLPHGHAVLIAEKMPKLKSISLRNSDNLHLLRGINSLRNIKIFCDWKKNRGNLFGPKPSPADFVWPILPTEWNSELESIYLMLVPKEFMTEDPATKLMSYQSAIRNQLQTTFSNCPNLKWIRMQNYYFDNSTVGYLQGESDIRFVHLSQYAHPEK